MSPRTTLPTLLAAALAGCQGLGTPAESAPAARSPYPTVVRGTPTPVTTARPTPPPPGSADYRPVTLYEGSRQKPPPELPPQLPPLPTQQVPSPAEALVGNPATRPAVFQPTAAAAMPLVPPPTPVAPKAEATPAKPAPRDPLLLAVFRAYLEKRPDEGIALLRKIEQPNQDLLLCLVPIVVRLSESGLSKADPEEQAVLVEQLQRVLGSLRAFAALRLDPPHFCRQPEDDKVYGIDPKHQFRPGELVHVFLRPRNFSVAPVGDDATAPGDLTGTPRYRPKWVCSLELQTSDGRSLGWQREFQAEPSNKLLPNYFEVLRFSLPDDLVPGVYRLVVEVRDLPTQRSVRQNLTFQVADDAGDGQRSAH